MQPLDPNGERSRCQACASQGGGLGSLAAAALAPPERAYSDRPAHGTPRSKQRGSLNV